MASYRRRAILATFVAAAVMTPAAGSVAGGTRPKVVPLPQGFQPEGIAVQGRNTFFVGSIPTGAIYKGDLTTGDGDIFVEAQEGRSAIGLSLRNGTLYVAGGPTGQAYAYDAQTAGNLGTFELTAEETFVNDVVATRDAAYFTDSMNPVLYRVPIEGDGMFGAPETIPLTGDLVYQEGFNANGIDAVPNGSKLMLVQSNTGLLFKVDPDTGGTSLIDLGDETVQNGDGILFDHWRTRSDRRCVRRPGRPGCLWVLQNQDNRLTLVRLGRGLRSGEVVRRFRDRTFDVPTTLDRAGSRYAVVNARFGVESPETADYWVTQKRRPR